MGRVAELGSVERERDDRLLGEERGELADE